MAIIQRRSISFGNVKAILFDKDGTLADSHAFLKSLAQQRSRLIEIQVSGLQAALLNVFGLVGEQLNPMGLMAVGTRQENLIAAAALIAQTGRGWIEAMAIAQAAFTAADHRSQPKAELTPLFDGALPLLQTLARSGFKIGILSSDSEENVREFVHRYQLAPYLQLQMGTLPGLSKPDPRLLHLACEKLEVSPQTTIVIGDSQADIELADKGGAIGSIGVTWGGTSADELAGADVVVDSFDELQSCGLCCS